jgi:hypothetical protein
MYSFGYSLVLSIVLVIAMQKLQGCTSVKVSLSVLLRLKLGDELLWTATVLY